MPMFVFGPCTNLVSGLSYQAWMAKVLELVQPQEENVPTTCTTQRCTPTSADRGLCEPGRYAFRCAWWGAASHPGPRPASLTAQAPC